MIIAEDDPINMEMMVDILSLMGITPVCAKDGIEAVEAFNKTPTDLIIMDIRMPNKDGIEAIKEIREKNTTIPIIALTASVSITDKEIVLKVGANDFLLKPINIEELRTKMYKLLFGET